MLLLSSKKENKCNLDLCHCRYGCFVRSKRCCSLYRSCINFSSQWPADLPVLPTRWIKFCAGLREAPHLFFSSVHEVIGERRWTFWATSSFIFWKNGVSLLLLEGVPVRRSLIFKIGFRIMNGGSWTQQHTTNERTQRTNSNFQRVSAKLEAQNWHGKGYGGNNKTSALMRLMLANKHITSCAKEAVGNMEWTGKKQESEWSTAEIHWNIYKYIRICIYSFFSLGQIWLTRRLYYDIFTRFWTFEQLRAKMWCAKCFLEPLGCCRSVADLKSIVSCRGYVRMLRGWASSIEDPWKGVYQASKKTCFKGLQHYEHYSTFCQEVHTGKLIQPWKMDHLNMFFFYWRCGFSLAMLVLHPWVTSLTQRFFSARPCVGELCGYANSRCGRRHIFHWIPSWYGEIFWFLWEANPWCGKPRANQLTMVCGTCCPSGWYSLQDACLEYFFEWCCVYLVSLVPEWCYRALMFGSKSNRSLTLVHLGQILLILRPVVPPKNWHNLFGLLLEQESIVARKIFAENLLEEHLRRHHLQLQKRQNICFERLAPCMQPRNHYCHSAGMDLEA